MQCFMFPKNIYNSLHVSGIKVKKMFFYCNMNLQCQFCTFAVPITVFKAWHHLRHTRGTSPGLRSAQILSSQSMMILCKLNRTSLWLLLLRECPEYPEENTIVGPPLATSPPSLHCEAPRRRCVCGLNDSKFNVLFSKAPSMLQNIPPYFIRGRGESEPSRESREERSSSGELLLSDITGLSGLTPARSEEEKGGRRTARRSWHGWRPQATNKETRGSKGRGKGGHGGGIVTSNWQELIRNERGWGEEREGGEEEKSSRGEEQALEGWRSGGGG